MGSWVRTITSPFRKARTILNQQQISTGNSGSITSSGNDEHRHRPKKQRRHSSSSATPSTAATRSGGGGDDVEVEVRSSQLYGHVMACAYEDVQVMWSMLDNKAGSAASAAATAAAS